MPEKQNETTSASTAIRLAPYAGAASAVGVGLLVRQVVGMLGLGESPDGYGALRVLGVMTLAGVAAWWAGRWTRQLPAAFILGTLAGLAAGSFAHETIPAAAGLVILTYAGLRVVSRFLRWAVMYALAGVYGGSLGVGAHYVITLDDLWYRYPQAGAVVVIGLALAGFVASWFGGEPAEGRFAWIKTSWVRLNRASLMAVTLLGLSATIYGLQGQDLADIANRIRTPIEQRVVEFKEAKDRVNTANDFKTEIDRILNRGE